MKLKLKSRVNIIRDYIPKLLKETLPAFIFNNAGTVVKKSGDRICVNWHGEGKFWFDSDVLKIEEVI